jgi:hypothetical protein
MQNRNDPQSGDELKPEEKALREKLLNDGDETNLDRSSSRDGEFGGGFGEGHYTGTSWDPESTPQKERDDRAKSAGSGDIHGPVTKDNQDTTSPDLERAHPHRPSTVHDDDYGAAGAGRFGGVKGPGLTTGAASPTTPR